MGRSAPKVDCTWEEWTIGNCNATCGGGIRTDTREKKTAERGGGYCDETYSREVACNTQACPRKNTLLIKLLLSKFNRPLIKVLKESN